MTLATLQQLVSDAVLAQDTARGESPRLSDITTWVNWAYRVIARRCNLTARIGITLTASQLEYNIGDTSCTAVQIIEPYLVYINNGGSTESLWDCSSDAKGIWTYDEMDRENPAFLTAPAGTPISAYFYNYNKLGIYPPPTSTVAAYSGHAVYGRYLPAALASPSDVPDLPPEIHEAIAWLAAVFAITPTVTEENGWTRLKEYNSYWAEVIAGVSDQNQRTLESGGTTTESYFNDFVIS